MNRALHFGSSFYRVRRFVGTRFLGRGGEVIVVLFGALALGCSGALRDAPNIVVPLPGEETSDDSPSKKLPPPKVREEKAPPPRLDQLASSPDPAPVSTTEWFQLRVRYDRGEVKVLSVEEVHLSEARATERRMGRFAVEIFQGTLLLDRVRFDFPLVALEEDKAPSQITSEATVMVPALPERTGLRVLDRKSARVFAVGGSF